jgi:hypothetical protein
MRLTREEIQEMNRLFEPQNREEFELLIKQSLTEPTHPLIEKLGWETLAMVRSNKKMIDDLVRQLKEEQD